MQHFYIEFPPFSGDPCRVLTEEEWTTEELPANHNYEHVTVGADSQGFKTGDFRTKEELYLRWDGVKKS